VLLTPGWRGRRCLVRLWPRAYTLTPKPGQAFEIVMHVYTPEGEQGPAVEARHAPAAAAAGVQGDR